MDPKLSKNQQIERLIRSGEIARSVLTAEVASFKAKLDVPSRVRNSLRGHPTGWLLGSAVSGLLASLLFRRKPAPVAKKPRGLPWKFLALLLTVVRPMAKVWLTGHVKNYLTGNNLQWAFGSPRVKQPQSFKSQ